MLTLIFLTLAVNANSKVVDPSTANCYLHWDHLSILWQVAYRPSKKDYFDLTEIEHILSRIFLKLYAQAFIMK